MERKYMLHFYLNNLQLRSLANFGWQKGESAYYERTKLKDATLLFAFAPKNAI